MGSNIYQYFSRKISEQSGKRSVLYSSLAIVLLFALTVYMVYIAPIGVDKIYCAILLVIFWYSRANYFWFAFFIIISAYPAGLFTETTNTALRRLPIYSPMAKVSFDMLDLFLIIAVIKAMIKGKKIILLDIFNVKKIPYIIIYIVLTSVFFGVSLKVFLNMTVRGLFFYTLFYSFPALINTKQDVYKFMTMFLPFVFFEVISQIFTIRTGLEFSELFNPGSLPTIYNSISGDVRAIATGYIIIRLAFVFAFVLLDNKAKIIPNFYAISVILVGLFSIIISATRSAITMFMFIFVMYFVLVVKKRPNIILQLVIFFMVSLFVLDITNVFSVDEIFGTSYQRYVSAVSIEQGSVKAEDTFENRLEVRLPLILTAIKNSIFLGYGFSDRYFQVYDGHMGGILVGLLQAGIFGYTFYIIFIFNLFKKCLKYIRKFSEDNSFLLPIKVFTLSFFGYLIINLTVDPIFVLNMNILPQDIFVHIVIATILINFGMREHLAEKTEKNLALTAA